MPVSNTQTVTVAKSGKRSASFEVGSFERGSFQTPDEITASNFQIEVSNDNSTFAAVKADAQTDVAAVALAADKVFNLPANVFKAKHARLYCASAQAAARSFTVHLAGP